MLSQGLPCEHNWSSFLDMGWQIKGPVHKGMNHVPKGRFGSWSASWLCSWFKLRAFTCIANAFPITNRICALWGNILFLLRRLTHAWLQLAFPKCARMNHVPKELCVHTSSESGFLGGSRSKTPFLGGFKSLIWKSFLFTKGKIRLSNQERVRITYRNGFWNVFRSFVNRPYVRWSLGTSRSSCTLHAHWPLYISLTLSELVKQLTPWM